MTREESVQVLRQITELAGQLQGSDELSIRIAAERVSDTALAQLWLHDLGGLVGPVTTAAFSGCGSPAKAADND
jgi:hypothetical protein